jgi:two-component system nitrate/nitrite response regulator NarL
MTKKSTLTAREIEVLVGVSKGLTNKEIGRDLYIAERAVELHLEDACRKLGAKNRIQAANAARAQGIIA